MNRTNYERRGVTLLELLVVVTLIGIFSSVVAARFGRTVFGNIGSNADARRISLLLLQARRSAITTGDNHFVEFTMQGTVATHYRLMRRTGAGDVQVVPPAEMTEEVTCIPSHNEMEFTFEGQALAAYSVELKGDERTWNLAVTPVNGVIRTWEN